MSTMANVDKTGVPKVTGNVCWSSAMVLWRRRECVLVECHGTVEEEGMWVECHGAVEEEGMCVGRVPWYSGGGGNVCWPSAMVLWRRRECVLAECNGTVEEEGMCVGRVP